MVEHDPAVELVGAFSSANAVPAAWAQARTDLQAADLYWLSTVRPDGRPHVTPLLAIWLDRAMYFCTGETERKARNLVENARCILTTGRNTLDDGLDLVVEGEASAISDMAELRSVADTFESKYGPRITAPAGTWFGLGDAIRGGKALVYRLAPTKVLGFGKGTSFSQTRWTFALPNRHRCGWPQFRRLLTGW